LADAKGGGQSLRDFCGAMECKIATIRKCGWEREKFMRGKAVSRRVKREPLDKKGVQKEKGKTSTTQ